MVSRTPRKRTREARTSAVPKKRTPRVQQEKVVRRNAEILTGTVVAWIVVLILLSFWAASLQRLAMRSGDVAAVVSSVLADMANQDRAQNNLAALTVNQKLVAVAQAKANDMAAKSYFAHVSPEGIDPWHWYKQEGYAYEYAGENLAIDFSDSGDVNTAWMNSPAHRANILGEHFTEIGIATAEGVFEGKPTIFVVQEFASPAKTSQSAVREAMTPGDAEKIAVVDARPTTEVSINTQVLGASDKAPEPVVTQQKNIPLWGYAVSFPKATLRYVYVAIAFFVLFGLLVETGLEVRWHHRKRAAVAGALLLLMCGLFIAADQLFFVHPVLAYVAA